MATSRKRRAAFVVAAVLLGLVAILSLGELSLRASGRRPRAQTVNGYLFLADPHLGWRNRPDARYEFEGPGSLVTTGARGERSGVRSSADPTGPTVLFVGDSTTFCAEVNDDATGPSEVARRLDPAQAPSVVNAGVRAYGTVQSLRMAREWLGRAPVKVVVYTFAENDLVENVDPIVYLPCWAPRGRLSGETLAFDEPPEPATRWGEPFDDTSLLRWDRRLLLGLARRSAVAAFAAEHVRLTVKARTLEDGASGPLAPAQYASALEWADAHGAGKVLALLLRELDQACSERGAKLLVTRFTTGDAEGPVNEDTTRGRFLSAIKESGVRFFDLGPFFKEPPEAHSYQAKLAGGTFDAHYGPHGTETYGAALAPVVHDLLEQK